MAFQIAMQRVGVGLGDVDDNPERTYIGVWKMFIKFDRKEGHREDEVGLAKRTLDFILAPCKNLSLSPRICRFSNPRCDVGSET